MIVMLYTRFGVWFQAVGPLVPFSTTYSTAPIYSHYPHPTMLPTDCVPVCQSVPVATESIHQVSVHKKIPSMQQFLPESHLVTACNTPLDMLSMFCQFCFYSIFRQQRMFHHASHLVPACICSS